MIQVNTNKTIELIKSMVQIDFGQYIHLMGNCMLLRSIDNSVVSKLKVFKINQRVFNPASVKREFSYVKSFFLFGYLGYGDDMSFQTLFLTMIQKMEDQCPEHLNRSMMIEY